jgi:SAM-dependent methyltransferase
MMPAILGFVRGLMLRGKTLDVGSFNVNGCVRPFFTDYIGVDMRQGPNVDMVMNAHHLEFPDATFDNVLCMEMLEHDDAFWVSVAELKRVLKPGGTLVITVPGIGFPKHDYPSDYWRFTAEALNVLFQGYRDVRVKEVGGTVMAVGVKP